jgi:hypothetical protein
MARPLDRTTKGEHMQIMDVLTQMGGLASMLDLNGDGNPLDDVLLMAGKMMR